jgi:thioredoxin reductase (NADPH)
MSDSENVIIVGSGPAGYTAALYTARANLSPLVIEGFAWGGLLQQTTDVENYPGFPDGIMGPEMMQKFRDQAERFGARLITDQADRVKLASEPGAMHSVWVGDTEHQARTVILAMGAEHRKLGVSGEEELAGRGVSYCATCDAAFFRDAHTMIVGGGDSAMEEATFLAKFASKVTVVHRREDLRASPIMVDRAKQNDKIEWALNAVVDSVVGGEVGKVTAVILRDVHNGETRELEADGLFVAVGHDPNTKLFLDWLDHDPAGYLVTLPGSTRTNIDGVFVAGDVQDHVYRQAVTAAGSGCMAALDAERFLAAEHHREQALAAQSQ